MAMDSGDELARAIGNSALRSAGNVVSRVARDAWKLIADVVSKELADAFNLVSSAYKTFIGFEGQQADIVVGQTEDGALVVANSFSTKELREGYVEHMKGRGFDAAAVEIPDEQGRFEAVIKTGDAAEFQRAVDACEDWLEEQSFIAAIDEWEAIERDQAELQAQVETGAVELEAEADGLVPIVSMEDFNRHLAEVHEARMAIEAGMAPAAEVVREGLSAPVR